MPITADEAREAWRTVRTWDRAKVGPVLNVPVRREVKFSIEPLLSQIELEPIPKAVFRYERGEQDGRRAERVVEEQTEEVVYLRFL